MLAIGLALAVMFGTFRNRLCQKACELPAGLKTALSISVRLACARWNLQVILWPFMNVDRNELYLRNVRD